MVGVTYIYSKARGSAEGGIFCPESLGPHESQPLRLRLRVHQVTLGTPVTPRHGRSTLLPDLTCSPDRLLLVLDSVIIVVFKTPPPFIRTDQFAITFIYIYYRRRAVFGRGIAADEIEWIVVTTDHGADVFWETGRCACVEDLALADY